MSLNHFLEHKFKAKSQIVLINLNLIADFLLQDEAILMAGLLIWRISSVKYSVKMADKYSTTKFIFINKCIVKCAYIISKNSWNFSPGKDVLFRRTDEFQRKTKRYRRMEINIVDDIRAIFNKRIILNESN